MGVIGFDTSNYTTSIAYFNGSIGDNISQLLPVKEGELGLRQSDAVFHHTKSLPDLSDRLFSRLMNPDIQAIGVSTQPRAIAGSYMPCFMVGYSHAKVLSDALKVPLFTFSHQQGHVAAALWSADRMDLMDRPHLAWHLSGGTTELLLVTPQGKNADCRIIGGTTDISAGQLIDRTGQLLKLPFPAGKYIDELSRNSTNTDFFPVKCAEMEFSLSGVQNKVQQFYGKGSTAEDTASYTLRSVVYAVMKATRQAMDKYPGLPIVFSGGVASNSLLREEVRAFHPVFAEPCYSTDNALGIAVLTHRHLEE